MNQIKYKAWDEVNEIMQKINGIEFYEDGTYRCIWGTLLQDWVALQFTGITDKEKEEIYKKDIIELECEYAGTQYNEGDDAYHWLYTGVVEYMPSLGYHLKMFKCWDLDNDEAVEQFAKRKNIVRYRSLKIGNEYENPELLT